MARRSRRWWLPAAGVTVVIVGVAAVLLVVLPGRTRAGATSMASREQATQPDQASTGARAAAGVSPPPTHPPPTHPPAPRKPAVPADGTGLTIVGDSLTDGPRRWIEQALPAAVIRAKGFQKWSWGMAQLPELRAAGQLRPTLAFLMGTNFGATEADVDNLIAAAPEVRTFILMTVHVPPKLDQLYRARTNAVIAAAAARHPHVTIKVEDWNGYAAAHPYLLGPDGIHPTPQGAAPLAQLLRATVYGLPVS